MPVYRLEPIAGTERHRFWRTSLVPPVPVWVLAASPDHARQRMQLATQDAPASAPGNKTYTPWNDAALVKCTEDASHNVTADVAVFANGKITLKLPAT